MQRLESLEESLTRSDKKEFVCRASERQRRDEATNATARGTIGSGAVPRHKYVHVHCNY